MRTGPSRSREPSRPSGSSPAPRSAPPSELYSRIWAVVARIPKGRVATYGQIAALAGIPHAPRVVGYALHRLPEGSRVPWHRVINVRGEISLRAGIGSEDFQKALLRREGIRLVGGRVDLETAQWRPRRISASAR